MIHRPDRESIVAGIRERVPKTPGVYVFVGEDRRVLYIGKSVSLRQRMLSYFSQDLDRIETRLGQMIFAIEDFEVRPTETEFLALLLEDELIKEHHPRFNVKQNEYEENRYLLLTDDEFPTCRMIDHGDEPASGRVYGPFKDRYFVEDLLELIRDTLHIRSCQEARPRRVCQDHEIGRCPGPCVEAIAHRDYGRITEEVAAFLDGGAGTMISRLTRAMEERSAHLQFEKAAELKERREFCERFCQRQRFLRDFKARRLLAIEHDPEPMHYVFERGRLVSHESHWSDRDDKRLFADRGHLVYRWLHQRAGRREFRFEG